MTADSGGPMRRARRLDSQNKAALVLAAADAALTRAGQISISGVARDAGVGRKFIYDHPDLKAQIELKATQATTRYANDMTSAARVTAASLRAELANTRAQNHRLNSQLRAVEKRLSQTEGARMVADNLLPDAMIASLADQQLARRNREFEQQLFEAQERSCAPPRNSTPPGPSTASSCSVPIGRLPTPGRRPRAPPWPPTPSEGDLPNDHPRRRRALRTNQRSATWAHGCPRGSPSPSTPRLDTSTRSPSAFATLSCWSSATGNSSPEASTSPSSTRRTTPPPGRAAR